MVSSSEQSQHPTMYQKRIYKPIEANSLYGFSAESRIQEDYGEYKVYKTGYLVCKRVMDKNGRKTKKYRRSWKNFSAFLQGMALHLHGEDLHTQDITIRLHHAVAYPLKYKNKPYILYLKTADSRVFYLQAKSEVEQRLWISNINLIAARYSAPPLTVSDDIEVQRYPVLPSYPSPLSLVQQRDYTKVQLQKVSQHTSFYKEVPLRKDMPPLDDMEQEVRRYTTYLRALEKFVRDKH